jgi:hypothetical protein
MSAAQPPSRSVPADGPARRGGRGHRGLHPQDARLFLPPEQVARLREAAADLAWLLERDYAPDASLKLVGDRYRLRQRQRMALRRSVCAPSRAAARRARCLSVAAVRGRPVVVDGLNQLITLEVAFSGGIVLRANDGALRDLASVHGTYRLVRETPRAAEALGAWLARAGATSVTLLLDAPVSNTGRMATLLRELAADRGWPWEVTLVPAADPLLKAADGVVATSDGGILDASVAWLDLAGAVVRQAVPDARVLDLWGEDR